ncbi:hypothetical protein [Flavobacterium pedocola]
MKKPLAKIEKKVAEDSLIYLEKLLLVGDFDGDGKSDTIQQNVINENTKEQIDHFPNSVCSSWDSIASYFDRNNADIILTMKNRKCDTLHLGSGGGLYCLINIGDNNKDKKDEIALVPDHYSFSNIIDCKIYTICNGNWTELKTFKVFRSAFDYERGKSLPRFNQIRGYLEYRKNKWHYIDYYDWWGAETAKDSALKPLKIKKGC